MIETFYNENFTVYSNSTSSYTAADSVTTGSTFTGLLRPVTEVARLFVESNLGKEFDLICDDSVSISVANNVTSNDTFVNYNVLGVSKYVDLEDDTDSHLDVRVVASDD